MELCNMEEVEVTSPRPSLQAAHPTCAIAALGAAWVGLLVGLPAWLLAASAAQTAERPSQTCSALGWSLMYCQSLQCRLKTSCPAGRGSHCPRLGRARWRRRTLPLQALTRFPGSCFPLPPRPRCVRGWRRLHCQST